MRDLALHRTHYKWELTAKIKVKSVGERMTKRQHQGKEDASWGLARHGLRDGVGCDTGQSFLLKNSAGFLPKSYFTRKYTFGCRKHFRKQVWSTEKKICWRSEDTVNGLVSSDLGGGDSRNGGVNGLGWIQTTSGVHIREEDGASQDGMEYQFGDNLWCGMNWIAWLWKWRKRRALDDGLLQLLGTGAGNANHIEER